MPTTEEKKKITSVKFVFDKPEDYKRIYVNGVHGGVTSRGDLVCNFFYEHPDTPASETMPLVEGVPQTDKASREDREKHEPNEVVIIRDLRVGLIIPIHLVSSIANWMLDKLKESKVVVEKEEK